MSGSAAKTPATRAVETLLGGLARGFVDQAAAENPAPPLAEDNETISPSSIVDQMKKHLAKGDHISAARLSLILASWLARGENLSFREASKLAGLSWSETAALPPPQKLR